MKHFTSLLEFRIILCLLLVNYALIGCWTPPPQQPGGGPTFTINSPAANSSVSGAVFFSAQPDDPSAVASVNFKAGGKDLGTDTNAADGFRVFLIPRDFPDGSLALTATLTGKDGKTTTERMTVTVVGNPPSSATVGAQGAILGTTEANGAISTLSVPPGANDSASISLVSKTKEEIKASTGVDYDALGVTFLGAQEISSSKPLEGPVNVSSGGFGPAVQPGQAVVNYRIMPDADGDGKGELVVVNTASVAPNNDVISDPIPNLVLTGGQVATSEGTKPIKSLAQSSTEVAPGDLLRFDAKGFSVGTSLGLRAVFKSTATGEVYEFNAVLVASSEGGATKLQIGVIIPLVPPGAMELRLKDTASGRVTAPVQVQIKPSAPVSGSPVVAARQALADIVLQVKNLNDVSLSGYINRIEEALIAFDGLKDDPTLNNDPVFKEWASFVKNAAGSISAAISVAELGNAPFGIEPLACHPDGDKKLKSGGIKSAVGVGLLLAAALIAFSVTAPITAVATAAIFVTGGLGANILASGITDLIDWSVECSSEFNPPPPPCSPSLSAGGGGAAPTGMGSAPPPGGGACGGASGSSGGSSVNARFANQVGLAASAFKDLSGRYAIKIRVGAQSVPFTGVSDASGYFFIPFIPEGQPYIATAIDRVTGQKRTLEGIGPATGKYDFLFFDFFDDGMQFNMARWDGGGDGTTWSDARNWSNDTLPTPTDKVVIDVPGEATIRLNSTVHVVSLESKEALMVDNTGILEIDAASTVDNAFSMSFSSVLKGTGALTVNGPLNVTGGLIDEATLNSAGRATLSGSGTLTLRNTATLNNLAGGTFDLQGDFTINFVNGSGTTFNNAGTLSKSAGTGVGTISCAFNNSGTVNVTSGTLSLGGTADSGSSTGTFNVTAGTTLRFVGNGTLGHTLTGSVAGAGMVEFTGGTSSLNAGSYNLSGLTSGTTLRNATVKFGAGLDLQSLGSTLSVLITSNLELASGEPQTLDALTLNTSGIVTASDDLTASQMTLTVGTLRGPGSLNIPAGGSLSVAVVYLDGKTLNNAGAGTLPLNGSVQSSNGAVVNNLATGSLELQNFARLSQLGAQATPLNNAGTITSIGDDVRVGMPVNNTGTVRISSGGLRFTTFTQTAGATVLTGGALATQNGLDVQGGSLEGAGTISGGVTNGGTLRPGGTGIGSLTIQGPYNQTTSGNLELELGGTATGQFDQLTIGGVATLAGTLSATLSNGFTPASGNSFEVLKYTSRSGDFTTKTLPGSLQASFGATSMSLVVP